MNIFQYAFMCEENWKQNMSEMTDYEPFTTFFSDLSIAEACEGLKGVKETYYNVVKHWLNDYKYFTEFVVCLNHKSWEMDARIKQRQTWEFISAENLDKLMRLYADLYEKAVEAFHKKYEGNEEAESYFFNVTD